MTPQQAAEFQKEIDEIRADIDALIKERGLIVNVLRANNADENLKRWRKRFPNLGDPTNPPSPFSRCWL